MDARKILLAGLAVLAIGLVAPAGASAKVVWLCKPGLRANPCEPSLPTTVFSPSGKRLGVQHAAREHRPVTPFGKVAQGVFGCGRVA